MCVHGLSDKKKLRRVLKLPEDAWRWECWGSSHGWLAMVDLCFQPFLFNPISGARINLPRFRTLPEISHADTCTLSGLGQHCLTGSSVGCAYYASDGEYIQKVFPLRLVLSSPPSDPSCIAMAVYSLHHGRLAFARPGDPSWTRLRHGYGGSSICFVSDLLYHGGMFWALSGVDTLDIFSVDPSNNHFVRHVRLWPQIERERRIRDVPETSYLMATPSGIVVVQRLFTAAYPRTTTDFHVYLLVGCNGAVNKKDMRWEEVRSIGDRRPKKKRSIGEGTPHDDDDLRWEEVRSIGDVALLVGHKHSVSVPAAAAALGGASSNYMPNCIYFADASRKGHDSYDLRLFHIGEGKFHDCARIDRAVMPPTWITPTMDPAGN